MKDTFTFHPKDAPPGVTVTAEYYPAVPASTGCTDSAETPPEDAWADIKRIDCDGQDDLLAWLEVFSMTDLINEAIEKHE